MENDNVEVNSETSETSEISYISGSSEKIDTTCLICMEDNMSNDSILVCSKKCKCSKFYHIQCFLEWYKNEKKCLICHKKLSKSDINIFIYNIESNDWESITLESIIKVFNLSRRNEYQTLVNIEDEYDDIELLDDGISDTSQDIESYEMIVHNNFLSFIKLICKTIFILLIIITFFIILYLFVYLSLI